MDPAAAIVSSFTRHGIPTAWIEDPDVKALIGVMSKVALAA
jgi:hypothetical protein